MALNPVKPLYSASATATNGSTTIQVTGNVNCSFLASGAIVALGTRQLVDAVSGTAPDISGNSTITLRRPWSDPTTTGPLLVFMSYEGLADAVIRLRQIIDASEGSLEGSLSYLGAWDAGSNTLPTPPGEGLGTVIYDISVAGTVSGTDYKVGDFIIYDQFTTTWKRWNAGLGSAAYLNKGNGTNELPDNAQLNTRLGTTGNLGNAAQRNVGNSTNELPDNAQLNTRLGTTGNLGAVALLNEVSRLVQSANNSTSAVLSHSAGVAGPAINGRWSVDTANRFLEIVALDNLGLVQSGFNINGEGLNRIAANRSAFYSLYDKGNILGNVGVSGVLPTGAIMEKGTFGDWEFSKYADGRLEYRLPPRFWSAIGGGSPGVPFLTNDNLSFPVAFVGVEPSISVQYIGRAAYENNSAQAHSLSLGSVSVSCILNTTVSGPRYTLTAIGRWY